MRKTRKYKKNKKFVGSAFIRTTISKIFKPNMSRTNPSRTNRPQTNLSRTNQPQTNRLRTNQQQNNQSRTNRSQTNNSNYLNDFNYLHNLNLDCDNDACKTLLMSIKEKYEKKYKVPPSNTTSDSYKQAYDTYVFVTSYLEDKIY